jgi:hypothetical protein
MDERCYLIFLDCALASWTSETWAFKPEMWTLRIGTVWTGQRDEHGKNYNISYLGESASGKAKCFVIDAFASRAQ